ncbi:MAG: peptidoglycan-binding protein [Acidobacteria bacterium]|nr:peptidoglycan-binding protein [Acidobacteriota bacterium]
MSEIRNGISEPAKKVLGLSDRGEAVREIQAKLASKNLLPLNEADGVFGPITRRAVIKFQAANGLDPDGLVGPATRAKLFN